METPVGLRTFEYRSDRDGPVEAPNWSSLLGGALTNAGSIFDMLAPALRLGGSYYAGQRSADRMEEAARSYRQLGQDAASMASPISNARRGEWDARLSRLYEDPQGFLEGNPEYKAALGLGTGELAAKNAATGHNLGGKATTDQLRFLTQLGSQYIGKERDDLMKMAGYQFDPANASRYLMEGGKLEQEALIAAMAARLAPMGTFTGGNTSGGSEGGLAGLLRQLSQAFNKNPTGGGPSGGPGAGISPQSILQLISQLPSGTLSPDLFETLGRIPGGVEGLFSPTNPATLEDFFGPGYEQFVSQNPGFANAGGITDMNLGGLGVSPDWERLFGPMGQGGFSGYNPEGVFGESGWWDSFGNSVGDAWKNFLGLFGG